jgi:hypothetical protein
VVAFARPLANMLLAFALAINVYFVGFPVFEEELTTHVKYIAPKLTMPMDLRPNYSRSRQEFFRMIKLCP